MERIAFFDFDNTIYDGYTYADFINYVSEYILISDKYQKRLSKIIKETEGDYDNRVMKIAEMIGDMIKGWDCSKLMSTCNAYNNLKIFPWVTPVMKFLIKNNFQIVLVTASFEEMLYGALKILPIDKLLCSRFEKIESKYSGKIDLLINGEEKVKAIENVVGQDNSFVIGFGDSIGDAPMLKMMNLAFLVRKNNEQISQLALDEGWHIGDNPEVIIEQIKEVL